MNATDKELYLEMGARVSNIEERLRIINARLDHIESISNESYYSD